MLRMDDNTCAVLLAAIAGLILVISAYIRNRYEDCDCKKKDNEIERLRARLCIVGIDADPIVTELYRQFKDWSVRGFGADDVTWCEVKAKVVSLLVARDAEIEKLTLEIAQLKEPKDKP